MDESVEASAIPVQHNEEVVGDCHDNKDKYMLKMLKWKNLLKQS